MVFGYSSGQIEGPSFARQLMAIVAVAREKGNADRA
jgi:hypothetical protein